MKNKTTLAALLIAVLFAIAFGVVAGPINYADSMHYLSTAEHVVAGEGFTTSARGHNQPMKRWPPAYAAMIAAVLPMHERTGDAAMTVNAIMLGALVFLSAVAIGGDARVRIASAVVIGLSMWWRYRLVLSEAAFFPISLAGFILLGHYLRDQRVRWLIACAAAFALAFLTRYAGIAFIGGVAFVILFHTGRVRVRDAAIFSVIALTPCALWMLRNAMMAGSASGRSFDPDPFYLVEPVWLFGVCGAGIMLMSRMLPDAMSRAMAFVGGGYLVFIAFSITCLDHETPTTVRIALPAMIPVAVAMLRQYSLAVQANPSRAKVGGFGREPDRVLR